MNEIKQWVAVAKAHGWEEIIVHEHPWTQLRGEKPGLNFCNLLIPEYLKDLDAMRQAVVDVLATVGQMCDFISHLAKILGAESHREYLTDAFKLATATAAQMAEAFLRTLGLWEDGD